jgi:hypothetical protein
MQSLATPANLLCLVLYLVALHSALVGLTLIANPEALMRWAGFEVNPEPFFAAQAGVFHLVLAAGYTIAAAGFPDTSSLVLFAVLVKAIATFFLLLYYLLKDRKWVILASGVVDGCMGAAILLAGLNAGV